MTLRDNGKLAYYGSEAAEIDGVINDMIKGGMCALFVGMQRD